MKYVDVCPQIDKSENLQRTPLSHICLAHQGFIFLF